jgi:ribosomal protein S18 acetylase RimI-like enzyme
MGLARISGASDDDRARVFATLTSAFREDPVERWLYPEERAYDACFPAFLAAFGGEAFAHNTVWRLDDFAVVALWLSPGVAPDAEEIVRVLTTTVEGVRLADTMAALEQMDAAHPHFSHWYLPWFGVDAALQGSGLGGTLLGECLTVVDASGLPAYLETPNPRTIAFYERHGFRVTGSTRTPDCPVITFMLREPAGRRRGEPA